jgi:hypothetical protein
MLIVPVKFCQAVTNLAWVVGQLVVYRLLVQAQQVLQACRQGRRD